MNKTIDSAFKKAIVDGVFPAADLLVAKGGEVLYAQHYGDARDRTCFDISSVTKPVAAVTIAMMLAAEGLLKTDDTVYQWLPGARKPWHRQMTILNLINHTSGLPTWQPYYRELPISLIGTEAGSRFILDACYEEALLAKPGEKTIYSDIGFMMLGEILKQAGNAPLDTLFAQKVAKPLGLVDTFFVRLTGSPMAASAKRTDTKPDKHVPTPKHGLPSERPSRKDDEHRRFAPTEDCPWRERVIHGEVDDQNAFALGGVAGHAGLFSTAADLHKFTMALTRAYQGESDFLPHELVRGLLGEGKTKPEGDEFVFGWNRPSKRNSASGRHFSVNSIGHLGYTGCSIWIDLSKDFWIILLTNRIHPSTTNQKIKIFRPQIHDLIFDELVG